MERCNVALTEPKKEIRIISFFGSVSAEDSGLYYTATGVILNSNVFQCFASLKLYFLVLIVKVPIYIHGQLSLTELKPSAIKRNTLKYNKLMTD